MWLSAGRLVGLGTGALGALLLVRPERCASTVTAGRPVAPATVVRVLGLRSAAQGALIAAVPSRPTLLLGAVVDGLHAVSMYGLACVDARYRRPALASGAVATASLAAELLALPRHP